MKSLPLAFLLLACGQKPAPGATDLEFVYEPTCENAEEDVVIEGEVTWTDQVGPIVMEKCSGCHVDGGIAPFALDSFSTASPMAAAIAGAVTAKRMPPWPPSSCGDCQEFQHDRSLSDEQIATIAAWVDQGAPEGGGADLEPDEPARLEREDALVTWEGADYTPSGTTGDSYRCFLVDAPSATDAYFTAYEVRPGNPQVVHHVLIYHPDSEAAVADAEALDARDEALGYDCFGGAGVSSDPLVAWAPGGGATEYPEGTGLPIAGGRPLILQVHYNTANGTGADHTAVAITVEDDVETPAVLARINNTELELPPGQAAVTDSYEVPINQDIRVWGVLPHMHELGQSIQLTTDDGSEETCMIDIPEWDFHWQGIYLYTEPVTVSSGSTARITCVYDTTDRTETTVFGENTEDEMCLAFVYVTGA